MNGLICTNGKVLYFVVKQALKQLGISFQRDNQHGVLVWSDAIRLELFDQLHPYQVINRLPFASTWCRKVPFVHLLQNMENYFPDDYTFLPKTYILPRDEDQFTEALEMHDRKHIYKPDRGSLGHGIQLIEPDMQFKVPSRLAVAQEYIESYTIDNLKFDLRIYVLICSVSPLRIYICRNGVARFCTEDSSTGTKYSFLTNTAINARNPDAVPDKMTRMIADVFNDMKKKGVDTDALWERIDEVLILTVLSAYPYLSSKEAELCPNNGLPRCFQIIGCDILLDKNLKPYILEINHRPSMKTNTENSKNLKIQMMKDALRIASPLQPLQQLLRNCGNYPTTNEEMTELMKKNQHVLAEIKAIRATNELHNSFDLVFPCKKQKINQIKDRVSKMPAVITEEFEPDKIERNNSFIERRRRRP